jgi:hypothetical protein
MAHREEHRQLALRLSQSAADSFQVGKRRGERFFGDNVNIALRERQELLGADMVLVAHAANVHHGVLDEVPPIGIFLRLPRLRRVSDKTVERALIIITDRYQLDIAKLASAIQDDALMSLETD